MFLVPLVPNIWFFPIYVLVLYLVPAFDLIRSGRFRQRLEGVDVIVFILLILCSLSFLNVDLAYRSLQNYLRYYFGTYLLPILAYFAFRLIRFSDQRAGSLRNVVFASGILFSILCFYEVILSSPLAMEFDNPDQWLDGRVLRAGTLAGGSAHAGFTMTAFIALTLPFVFFWWPGKYPLRILALLLIELMGLTLILSRAGYIATLTCAITASLLLRGRRSGGAILIALLLFLIVAPSLPIPDWLSARLMDPTSSLARVPRFWAGVDFVEDNIRMGWQTALFGKGYNASYMWGGFYHRPGYSESGSPAYFLPGGFHNGYLTLLADQGILAFGCYVAILIIAGRRLLRHCKQFRFLKNRKLRSSVSLEPVGWGLILIAYIMIEMVHWQFYFPQRFYFFMALAMLLNLTSSGPDAKPSAGGKGYTAPKDYQVERSPESSMYQHPVRLCSLRIPSKFVGGETTDFERDFE